jgi:hypothetical protein
VTDEAPAPEAEATETLKLLDPDEMTLAELEEWEDLIGTDLVNAVMHGVFSPKAIRVLAYLTMKRSKPDATLDDVGVLRFGDVDLGPEDAEDESPNAPGSAG